MGRYAFLLAFLLVLAAPFMMRALVLAPEAEAEPRDPDALELRILTPHNQDIRRTFGEAFSAWHRARFGRRVTILYLTPGGTMDIVRYVRDAYDAAREPGAALPPEAGVAPVAELVWGGGDATFERELKPYLKPVTLPPGVLAAAFPAPDLNGIPLYDSADGAPRWVGVALSSFGILYSPELYRTLKLPPPLTWRDLTRAELDGWLALADPTRSGSAAIAYVLVVQRAMADAEAAFFAAEPGLAREAALADPRYRDALARGWKRGMQTLLLMAANARYFTDSASQPPNDVGNGEAAAAVAIDFYARVFQDQVGEERLRYVAPAAATAITPDPIAVLYGVRGEREQLANRFIEFLLTPEAQRLWNLKPGQSPYVVRSLRRLPIRRDVYRDRRGWADDVDPFEQAGDFNLRPEWMQSFRELRLVWAAAWIDSKTALDAAHRQILRVRDPARRAALLEQLSDLPIELRELTSIAKRRRALEQSPDRASDPRLFLAETRVELGARFRRHFDAVRERATPP